MLTRLRFSWLLALATASMASADPIVTAYTHRGGDLYLMQMTGAGAPILPQVVGATGVSTVCALAEGPGDALFAAVFDPVQPDELWIIDRETLAATAVGELGVEIDFQADLGDDGAGGLWLSTGGGLYSVDTATGQATAVGAAAELAAIAFDGLTLYGITGTPLAGDWSLVIIDPATGDQTAVADLELGGGVDTFDLVIIEAMDFDAAGGLWLLAQHGSGIIDPPIIEHYVHYLEDPASGVESVVSPLPNTPFWKPMAITGTTAPVVDVPVLGAGGLAVLALLLASMALRHPWCSRSAARRGPLSD